ncbi:WXG100 family type VII secretion target [Streptomyces specialis]|uniref:WXG100 family type VII secretion target n=1 Tax=Streptomyces specialis TaxID=498367 RepID=UPI00073EF9C0|nr:WXG100 family type VII secretion target [Streptomyces specialis]
MGDISVVYEALNSGSEGLMAEERQLLERMVALRSALRDAAAGWDGEAMRAFEANMRVFDEELGKLSVVLAKTGSALDTAGASYRSVDLRNAGRLMGG